MANKMETIEYLRAFLGDRTTSWLHALRYYWVLHTREPNEVDMLLIPQLVNKGDVVIDIGANAADWTWRLSKQVGSSGKVFAFEADPYFANVTKKVIALLGLGNVSFFSFGLSDKAGIARLQIRTPDNQRAIGTGHIIEAFGTKNLDDRQTVRVRIAPLDKIPEVEPYIHSIRLIKCDVEGHELNVFKGALNILQFSRPIVIAEVGHTEYQIDNEQQIFSFFESLDYACYVVGFDKFTLLPSRPGDSFPNGMRPNRIMIPCEKSAFVRNR